MQGNPASGRFVYFSPFAPRKDKSVYKREIALLILCLLGTLFPHTEGT